MTVEAEEGVTREDEGAEAPIPTGEPSMAGEFNMILFCRKNHVLTLKL